MGATANHQDPRTAASETAVNTLLTEKLTALLSDHSPIKTLVRSIDGYRESGTRVTELYQDGNRRAVLQVFIPTNGKPIGHLMIVEGAVGEEVVVARYSAEGHGADATIIDHPTDGEQVQFDAWEDNILRVFERQL